MNKCHGRTGFQHFKRWKACRLRWVISLLLIALSGLVGAEPIPTIDLQDIPSLGLGSYLAQAIDADGDWSAEQIAQQLGAIDWQQSDAASPNLGLLQAPVWFAVRLRPHQDFERLLEIGYPALDHVDIYLYANGQLVQEVHTGDHQPFKERMIQHRHFVVPLDLQAEQTYLLLIRVKSGGPVQVPVTLWEPHSFYSSDQYIFAAHMLFVGLMLALAIYNFLLFLSVRESSYLWYVAAVIGTLFVQLGIRGVSFQFLW